MGDDSIISGYLILRLYLVVVKYTEFTNDGFFEWNPNMSAKFEHRLINIDWEEYFAEKISKIEWELKISLWSQIHILYIDISGAARSALRRNRIDSK